MDAISQVALSPVRQVARSIQLPYGLSARDLWPVLGVESGSVDCRATHSLQGLGGGANSCIVILPYRPDTGPRHERAVFIEQVAATKHEAAHYGVLARHGVMTPRLLVAVESDGKEVLVLELLAAIGIDFRDQGQVDDLVGQIARLNSIPVHRAPVDRTPVSVSEQCDAAIEGALASLPAHSLATPREADEWSAAYRRAQDEVVQMPVAVTHGELYFQQIGVQADPPGWVVLFDLATLQVRPRFTDVANVLRPLAEQVGVAERAIFTAYLDELRQYGGQAVSEDAAWRELRTVRLVNACWSLPWRVGSRSAVRAPQLLPGLASTVDGLREDVRALA